MQPRKFRRFVPEIEAVQYDGDPGPIRHFIGFESVDVRHRHPSLDINHPTLVVDGIRGAQTVHAGDWVLRERDGSISVVPDATFNQTFELVDEGVSAA